MTILRSKVETLKAVRSLEQGSVQDIADEAGFAKSTVSDNLEQLLESGLISKTETSNPTEPDIRNLTRQGLERILDEKSGDLDLRKPNTSGEHDDPYFTHFFALICKWDDEDFLNDNWKNRLKEIESDEIEVSEQRDFNRVQVLTEKWNFKFTGRSLEIQLRSEVSGDDFRTIAWRAWRDCLKGLDLLEAELDQSIPRDRFEIRLKSHHVGSRGKDIAKTFIDHIDNNTNHEASDFEVLDDSEEIRVYADRSGPSGMLERESGNGGQKNGRKDTALDDSQLLQELTWKFLDNPSDSLRLVDVPSRVDALEGMGQEVKSKQEEHDNVLEELRNVVKELQSTQESERNTRDALIELVRSNQLTIQSNQDLIERQEEMIEKQSEIINSLQDELEDLRNSQSLEERVRERFENMPNVSTVHEHSNDGNRDLYVWDYRDGWENRTYRKVLDEEARIVA